MLAMLCSSNIRLSFVAILTEFVVWLSWLPLTAMLEMLNGYVSSSARLCWPYCQDILAGYAG
jgi:hypothetical protein